MVLFIAVTLWTSSWPLGTALQVRYVCAGRHKLLQVITCHVFRTLVLWVLGWYSCYDLTTSSRQQT
jgi:hypothetical protein